jgi:hypothetical protein
MSRPTIEELQAILDSRKGWRISWEFKLQDFWIGAYWKRMGNCVDLFVCLLPCLPIHISWWWSQPIDGELQ